MTIGHLCDPDLVFTRNVKAVPKTSCALDADHACLPEDPLQYDWFLFADLVNDHAQDKHTKDLCARFIRYLALKKEGRPLDNTDPVTLPADVDAKKHGVWRLVNENPLEPSKEPCGNVPLEMRQESHKTHYKFLQNAQYAIGCKQQLRQTPKAFPKTVAVTKIVKDGRRLEYAEQKKSFLDVMSSMKLEMVSTKNKTSRLEFKLANGQSATGVSFITDQEVTVAPGLHYEFWVSADRKCVRTLENDGPHFAVFKQNMKLGVDVWPLLNSEMAVTAAIGLFASFFSYVLRNVGVKDSPFEEIATMYPFHAFSEKIRHYIFGNPQSPQYKNKFIPIKMSYAFDNLSNMTAEQREDYARLARKHRSEEDVKRGSEYCSAIRNFCPNNVVEPHVNNRTLSYKPLWSLTDIGKNRNSVYKGFMQISMEPIYQVKTFTCRIHFATAILKPIDVDFGRLDADIDLDELEEDEFKTLMLENIKSPSTSTDAESKEKLFSDDEDEEGASTSPNNKLSEDEEDDEEAPSPKKARFDE